MKFDFQAMKPTIQREFDEILDHYPTDMRRVVARVPEGGDAYARKRALWSAAAEECPVHVFAHYPFACEIDVGELRENCYKGVGDVVRTQSGVDFEPLHELWRFIDASALGSFNDYTDHIHRTLDHDKLLTVGFRGVWEECAALNRTETDPAKKRYRELVMDGCRTVEKIGLRLRALAKERLLTAENEDARYNLRRIAQSPNTPWEAPETLFDAMNAILFTAQCISGLDGVEMNAYGAIDRLLFPFYERDLNAGRLTKEEAYFLLQCFLWRTDLHVHYNSERKNYDNGVSVMIGGCDLDGRPVYNAITDMVLDAYSEHRLIHPKLNARASADSPRAYIERLAALMKRGHNNLILENDDFIIPMFLRMGLKIEDARTYVGNGCQEVICRNQLHSRAFVYINTVQILLDTLRFSRGEAMSKGHRRFYQYGRFETKTFEALRESFLQNLRSYIRTLTEAFLPYERLHATICPEPMLAAFTADCVASGRDLTDGGARYTHKTLSLVGFGTLCDSLLRLRDAYAQNRVEELLAAMDANFEGFAPLRAHLKRSENRFGHSEAADAFAKALAEDLSHVSRGIYNAQGVEWHTSLFTYYLFQSLGRRMGATPDGRLAGEPLSRQMNMADPPVLTAAALSMAALTDAEFDDVGMFDFALPYTAGEDTFQQALADYLQTCLKLKIPVLQPNVADRQTMIEERDCKGTHPDLVVRICGYSAIFGELARDMQDEVIARLG